MRKDGRSSLLKRKRVTQPLPPKPALVYLIHQYISSKGYPVAGSEIAGNLNLNPGSVRSRLSKMVKKGILSRPYRGFYELNPRNGVGLSRGGLRAQNLVVVAEGIPVRPSSRVLRRGEASEEFHLGLRMLALHITFGSKRNKITYRVGVPLGLCPVGLELVHYLAVQEVERKGYKVPEEAWIVETIEFLEDFRGFRIEGLQGVTFWNIVGEMEKYYIKPGVRREVRLPSTRGVGLNVIRSLISEHVDASLFHRWMENFQKEMRKLKSGQKSMNRAVLDSLRKTENVTQVLLDKYFRDRALGVG